jgi:mannan endo-1,6-alpha-mannosidase
LDYSHYTGDTTYDRRIAKALIEQTGENNDYMPKEKHNQEGNDDLAFWGFAVMSAAERNFPQPDASKPGWLELGTNVFNSLAGRWNTSACGGGLLWQIFPDNPNGLDYRNTVSNGGLFQIAARLARATGNSTYTFWAEKVWDWTVNVGLIDTHFNVQDGASSRENCSIINPVSFSYSAAIYMYGSAVMYNHTGDAKWADRARRIHEAATSFFTPFTNATNIMYEHACEQVDKCNIDMRTFKGFLSRWTYASAVFVPDIVPLMEQQLHTSAMAAAKACTGGADGNTCGQKWYVGGFDGVVGMGEQMCALETIQGLLARDAKPPLKGGEIKVVRSFPATTAAVAAPASGAGGKSIPQ